MLENNLIKDRYREGRIFAVRVVLAGLLMTTLFGVLVARFYNLQITDHAQYATASDRNRVHVRSLPPVRGLIYDRKGRLLADNRPSYTLSLVLERVDDVDTTLAELQTLLPISERDFTRFNKQRRQRRRPYEPVPLKYRLNEEEIALIAVNEYRLDGVEVQAELIRHYPYEQLLAHTVGYVGRINDREQTGFDEEAVKRYSGTHTIGKIGLEKRYESDLLGQVGYQNVETNARGRVLRVLEQTLPQPGEDLHLYLDVDVQQTGFDALAGRRGAVVAIDVNTGGVLAMVSTPSYDPNLFVTGISYKDYKALNESSDLPLYNRTLQGQYPPASTVKPLLGLAGLHYGVTDMRRTIYDPGFYQLEGDDRKYRDWKKGGHGRAIGLKQAIAQSCDTYFYDLAFRMGIDKMHEFGKHFGLGARTDIDIPSERSGNWPSRPWKKGARGLPWFPGDSLNMSIGQGFTTATPLQLAEMTATLAKRGTRHKPQLVKRQGERLHEPEVVDYIEVAQVHWDSIFESMIEVVHGLRGTGQRIRRGAKYKMAGKTGTAQVVGIKQDEEYDSEALAERHRDHALFIGFAPADNPKIAVAVIVENGEHGSTAAAPIARKIFDAYLLEQGSKAKILAGVETSPLNEMEL